MADQQIIVVDLTRKNVKIAVDATGDMYIKSQRVADTANALLMALGGGPEAPGVVMLAQALGCKLQ